jgi:RNA polymerase sigma factor (sigma-70 family)
MSSASNTPPPEDEPGKSAGRFVATSWTAIAAMRNSDSPEAHTALARLCEAYWQPLYDYVRRLNYSEDDAKELTQEFFLRAVSKNLMAAADRDKGRFRTFLLTSLNYFLHNEWDRAHAAKRGGGRSLASLDETNEDGSLLHEPANSLTPEAVYEQSWATSLLGQANDRLGEEYAAAGKSALYETLKPFLEGSSSPRSYQAVAPQLKMTPNAVGVAVHRMRHRLRELIQSEVERTLVNPTEEEIQAEMLFLRETLSASRS